LGNLSFFKNSFRELVRKHGGRIDKIFPPLKGFLKKILRDIFNSNILSVYTVKIEGFHGYEIHNSFQIRLKPDGNLKGYRMVPQFFFELTNDPEWIGAAPVTLVYKSDTGHAIPFHLLVNSDGLRLNTAYSTQNQYGAV
jgi:hypothetical protein